MLTDLTGLNLQQRDCVLKSVDRNVVLLAGAGSGKTFTLVKRTEYLVRDLGVDPSEIMLVTFTRKAAGEMKTRIKKNVPGAERMTIGTIHSVCLDLLKKYGEKVGLKDFSVISEREHKSLFCQFLESSDNFDTKKNVSAGILNNCLGQVSFFKANRILPEMLDADPITSSTYKKVYRKYREYCRKNKLIDYDDIILYTYDLLKCKEVAEKIRSSIRYLMVDEAQDNSKLQNSLLSMIAGENTMMVGDVSQSIYGFRNARPEYLESDMVNKPCTIEMRLEQNYRSTENIVEAANELISKNRFENRITMFSEQEKGKKIRHILFRSQEDEAIRIAAEIRKELDEGKKKPSDYVLIYRENIQADILKLALEQQEIPYIELTKPFLLDREEIALALASISLPDENDDRNRYKSLYSHFHNEFIKNRYLYRNTNRAMDPDFEFMRGIEEVLQMAKEYDRLQPGMTLREKCETFDIYYRDQYKEVIEKSVSLTTVHTAKGLEWDTVYLVGCVDGRFPHRKQIDKDSETGIEEERRLFYVAMTRAKKRLYVSSYHVGWYWDPDKIINFETSRFLFDIPAEFLRGIKPYERNNEKQ
ncbi:MAG: ATP-dependent helicase [Eubacterium sp.]|nr:ATP-dependent helicase [Eubacterium sp.]